MRLVAITDHSSECRLFDLWRVRGRKSLVPEGDALRLRCNATSRALDVRIERSLADGDPFGYLLPACKQSARRSRAISRFNDVFTDSQNAKQAARRSRPTRSTVYHLRTLQAMDAVSAGASQREIASLLEGEKAVNDEWAPDSALRAHIRLLVRRGQKLIDGGYRSLINPN